MYIMIGINMAVNKLYFATTNEGKINEAKNILGVEVVGNGLEIEEIQSLDSSKVAVAKARDYYKKLKKPIFVEDVALEFRGLKGLPGTYINDFIKALGNEGLMKLLEGSNNREAIAITTIVFIDKNVTESFVGKMKGSIAKKPKGDKGFGWDPIFIPNGSKKTLAEMDLNEKNKYSMRAIALKKFKKWLDKS